MNQQFIKFIIVGGLSALIDLSVIYYLASLGFSDFISVTFGFIFGLLGNYFMHALYTFETRKLYIASGMKFAIVVGINYVITLACISLLTNTLGINLIAAKIVSLPFIAINGYLLSKHWVFSRHPDD